MPVTILLVQDNAGRAAKVQELLANSSDRHFAVEWIRTRAAATDRLGDHTKDEIAAVVIDLPLPQEQVLDAFDQIFQASPGIPILVLSDSEHEELAKKPCSAERRTTSWMTVSTATHCRRRCTTCSSARRTPKPCSMKRSAPGHLEFHR